MPNFLITGGAGFIGSHLAERCLLLGHRVVAVDDMSLGSRQHLAQVADHPRFELVEADVRDRTALARHMRGVHATFHLAAAARPSVPDTDWRAVLRDNHEATASVLAVAEQHDSKVLIASSGDVYRANGQPSYGESSELELQPADSPRALCRLTKLVDEALANESKAETIVARLFPTIGVRLGQGLGGEIGRFVLHAMAHATLGESIAIDEHLPEEASVVDVTDVVHWMLLLACDPRAVGQVFNLGSASRISIERLAGKILQVVDSRAALRTSRPGSLSDACRYPTRIPNIDRVLSQTGYRPRVKLDHSLRAVHAWVRCQVSGVR